MRNCAACSNQANSLIEVYAGTKVEERLPFCLRCVELGTCELPLLKTSDLGRTEILERAIALNLSLLDALRAAEERAERASCGRPG